MLSNYLEGRRMTEFEQMTDFEKQVDDAIVAWYHSSQYQGDYFNNYRWDELYDEQKQIAAQLFWEKMLS